MLLMNLKRLPLALPIGPQCPQNHRKFPRPQSLLLCSFVCLFVPLFVSFCLFLRCSCVCSFVCSFVRSFVRYFVYLSMAPRDFPANRPSAKIKQNTLRTNEDKEANFTVVNADYIPFWLGSGRLVSCWEFRELNFLLAGINLMP